MRPLFRWNTLQLHLGSPENAFESLVAILASRDRRFIDKNQFYRNGRPDGGVECFWKRSDSTVHGYQAKYHRDALQRSQWQQLDMSVKQALASYPTMSSLTICLPQDLPHSPGKGKRKSSRDKWDAQRLAWEEEGRRSRPSFTVDLWDETQITEQLAAPRNSDLLNFFFDVNATTPADTTRHVEMQIARVGARYQAPLHVQHELEPLFDWLTATDTFRSKLGSSLETVRRLITSPELCPLVPPSTDPIATFGSVLEALDAVALALRRFPSGALSPLLTRLDNTLDASLFAKVHNDDKRSILDLVDAIADVMSAFTTEEWRLAFDARFVAMTGEGGCGKTHLFCDAAQRIAQREHPVVLVLGQALSAGRWQQELLPDNGTLTGVLASLNAAGAASGCRGLLLIDAINEAEEPFKWPSELRALEVLLRDFPHVAVVLSVRDSFADALLPCQRTCPSLMRIAHTGFEHNPSTALRVYCNYYNIALPEVPILYPEFGNPLFLSIFCQAIAQEPDPTHQRPVVAFPGGHVGFEAVFSKFIDAKEKSWKERFDLDLDSSPNPLRSTIEALAGAMASNPSLDLPASQAVLLIAQHLKGQHFSTNRLALLESEGLILRVFKRTTTGDLTETVRFAFDRMHSHFIVSAWLGQCASEEDAQSLFADGGPLRSVVALKPTRASFGSLAEELILQWPSRFRANLFDSRPQLADDSLWAGIFTRSLTVAAPADWTESTSRWLGHCFKSSAESDSGRAYTVLRMLGRAGHEALADKIHDYLSDQPLSQRDSWWTTSLSREFRSNRDDELVSWPLDYPNLQLDHSQSLRFASALAWLTAVTKRALRAAATRSLAVVIGASLKTAPALLARFRTVNDPYVLESVSLGVYGACLRSNDNEAVKLVAESVLTLWPSKADWPLNVIARHSLAGIVELAAHRNPQWNVGLSAAQPPYSSKWIDTALSWVEIDERATTAGDRGKRGFSAIVRSCMPEAARTDAEPRSYGDFGRYVVGSAVWSFWPKSQNTDADRQRPFPVDFAHRYIITRVLELGWNAELFEDFDQHDRSISRFENPIERIGKKYQRIALSEFLARASDHFPIWPDNRSPKSRTYRFPDDVSQRVIADTSLVWPKMERQFGPPVAPRVTPTSTCSLWQEPDDDRWLVSPSDFPDPATCLAKTTPDGKLRALMLRGRFDLTQDDRPGRTERTRRYRSVRMLISSHAVRPSDLVALDQWMRATKANDGPGSPVYDRALFGELYWSREAQAESNSLGEMPDDEMPRPGVLLDEGLGMLPVPMISLAAQYQRASDQRKHEMLCAGIPSHWLADQLKLRTGPQDLAFSDVNGKVVCWNIADASPPFDDAAFVLYEPLQRVLDSRGLTMVWWIVGEKIAIKPTDPGSSKGPILPFFQGLYWLSGNAIQGWTAALLDDDFRTGRSRRYPPPFVLTEVWRRGAKQADNKEHNRARPSRSR